MTKWLEQDMNLSPMMLDAIFWLAVCMFLIAFVGLIVLTAHTIRQDKIDKNPYSRYSGLSRTERKPK